MLCFTKNLKQILQKYSQDKYIKLQLAPFLPGPSFLFVTSGTFLELNPVCLCVPKTWTEAGYPF